MDEKQWLEERRTGIGGSDAPVILGLSKWKTPYELYLEKRGEARLDGAEESQPAKWGKILEPMVLQEYANVTGRTIRTYQHEIFRHPTIKHAFFSPDALVPGERNVQAKTARSREGWGEPGSDEVPQAYIIQVQHEMLVSQLPVTDVPVLFGGQEFAIYEVPADRELQEMIRDAEEDFWQRVRSGMPPDPITEEDARRRYCRSTPNSVEASDYVVRLCEEYRAASDASKYAEEAQERLRAQIMAYMGESEALTWGGKVVATWKSAKGAERFDSKRFRAEHPALAQQYTAAGEGARRFIVKK